MVEPGVEDSLLGVTTRTGGSHQVTGAGDPLYRYSLDKQPGESKDLSPSGKKIDNSRFRALRVVAELGTVG